MQLYYGRGTGSLAPHMILLEIGAPFDLIKVDYRAKLLEDGTDFLTINPNGYVPVLRVDSGELLTEASVILEYLADQHPTSRLLPAVGSFERYRAKQWLSFVATELHKHYSVLFSPVAPEEFKNSSREKLAQRLAFVDRALTDGYLLGANYGVADAYLFVALSWSRATRVDLSALPAVERFQERVADRPATQAALRAEGLIQ